MKNCFLSLGAAFFLCVAPAQAATLTVTTNADDGGSGTLRSLIAAAHSGDTITFAVNLSGATIALTNNSNSGLALTKNVTIDAMALAQSVQINGNNQHTVFTVNSGVTASLNALTITNGNGRFGGIFNDGIMTLNTSTVAGNSGTVGGGIFNDGTMTLNASTVARNNANGGVGGGIYNVSTMTLSSSTVAGNSASEGGGGIYNGGGSSLNVTNSIVVGNNGNGGGDILNSGIATITYGGTNLVQSVYNSASINNASVAIITTNALLAPLGNYGGPTQTMPPLAGSPAIDAGSDAANTFTTDQRGELRLSGAHVDIGAVEVQQSVAVSVSATNITYNGATLNGTITPNDLTNQYYFAWGLTTNYTGYSVTNILLPGLNAIVVSTSLTGLLSRTTYHFQLFTADGVRVQTGGDLTFATLTATTNTLTTALNPATYGQSVTLTALIGAAAPGAGVPTGLVTFYDGAAALGMGTLDTNGIAQLVVMNFSAGIHSLKAIYSGNVNFTTSTSSTVTETVNQASLSYLAIGANTPPTVYGQPAVFGIYYYVSGGGTPTGTVTIYVNGTNRVNSFSTNALVNGLTITNAFLPVGSDTIIAIYSGDTNYRGGTSVTNHIVRLAATTNQLSSTLNPSVFGQSVTFTVMAGATAPGAGTPTGTVTFYNGAASLSTNTLDTNGIVQLSTAGLPAGTNSIEAVYAGSTNYLGSTSLLTQVISRAITTNTFISTINPTVFGQAVVFTVNITSGAGTPAGTVTFLAGTNSLATNTLVNGETSVTNATLPVGTNSITAVYSGDINFIGNTSGLAQVVNQAGTTNQVSTWLNPSVPGQAVTFTALVSTVAPGAGTPDGAVTFYNGAASFGTGILTNGMAIVTATNLTAGTNAITAVYTGDTNFLASTSALRAQTVLNLTNAALLGVGVVDHRSSHYLQTGLMQQTITVNNVTGGAYTAVRVTLHLTQAGITVYNATGTNNNGDAYLESDYAVPAHTSVTFTVEYYVANRTTIPNPAISVTVTTAAAPPVIPPGTPVTILQSQMLATNGVSGNAFLIGFKTQTGATYYVLYSGDMITWNLVQPAIAGNGNEVQWLDLGPPQTISTPATQTQRFYRVIQTQ